jgi:hypothetical protein
MTGGSQPTSPFVGYPLPVNIYAILSLGFALFVLPPLSIYFGAKAKQQIAQTGERGIELANAAIACGWVFSVIWGLFWLLWRGFAIVFVTALINR